MNEESEQPPHRRKGRPRRCDAPDIDWAEIERLYGEGVPDGENGSGRRCLSLRELSRKFGLSKSLIGLRARREGWFERREGQGNSTDKLTKIDFGPAPCSTNDLIQIIGVLIQRFAEDVLAGRVRVRSVADMNTAVRLFEYLTKQREDARASRRPLVSLAELQRLHRAARERLETPNSLPDESEPK